MCEETSSCADAGCRRRAFTVEGDFVTLQSRAFWCDEDSPDRALRLLLEGVIGLSIEQAFDVLCGRAKFVGTSSDPEGLELVSDDASLSPAKNRLPANALHALLSAFRSQKTSCEKWRELAKDLLEIANGETVTVASTTGARRVARRRCERSEFGTHWQLKRELAWDDVPVYIQVGTPAGLRSHPAPPKARESDHAAVALPPAESYPVPEPSRTVTHANGWLAPDGRFFYCEYGKHAALAVAIAQRAGAEACADDWLTNGMLEAEGWLKISSGEWSCGACVREGCKTPPAPTQAQRDAVFDYCTAHSQVSPTWLLEEGGEL